MTRNPLTLALALPLACAAPELPESDSPVGPRAEGGHVLPTRQVVEPAGTTIAFDGRPLDLVLSPDGRFVFVKEKGGVITIDAQSATIASRCRDEKLGASMHGIVITRAGDKLYLTGTEDQLVELAVAADGSLRVSRTLVLPQAEVGGDPYPRSRSSTCARGSWRRRSRSGSRPTTSCSRPTVGSPTSRTSAAGVPWRETGPRRARARRW